MGYCIYMSRTGTHRSGTRPAHYPKGVGHMTTTSVSCPQLVCAGCGGQQVEVLTSAKAKTVRLAACAPLLAQGWTGHQLAVAKTDREGLARIGVVA